MNPREWTQGPAACASVCHIDLRARKGNRPPRCWRDRWARTGCVETRQGQRDAPPHAELNLDSNTKNQNMRKFVCLICNKQFTLARYNAYPTNGVTFIHTTILTAKLAKTSHRHPSKPYKTIRSSPLYPHILLVLQLFIMLQRRRRHETQSRDVPV